MSFLKMICMTLTFKPMTLKTNYFMALLQQIVVYFLEVPLLARELSRKLPDFWVITGWLWPLNQQPSQRHRFICTC